MKIIIFLFVIFIAIIVIPEIVFAQAFLNRNTTWDSSLVPASWATLTFANLNNDTYDDLIFTGTGGAGRIYTSIYLNNGTNFVENATWRANLTNVTAASVVTGDLDKDGRLDVIITGCTNVDGANGLCPSNALSSKVYINNGTGLVENSTWESELTPVSWGSITLADIDSDGRLDLVLTGHTNNLGSVIRRSEVYVNNGTVLKKNSAWNSTLIAIDQSSISLVDLDGDSKLDLILTGQGDSSRFSNVYINSGTSFIENTSWEQPLLTRAKTSVVVGDFDNDGRTDILIQGFVDSGRLYRNNGTSLPINQTDILDNGPISRNYDGEAAWGDYTNDGLLDLAQNGNELDTSVPYNNVSYLFTRNNTINNLLTDMEARSSLAWNDMDNDGDIDLIQVGLAGANNAIHVYTNNATIKNTAPNASTLFNNSYSDGKLILNWSNASDAETPSLGLYYNLRVGSCSGCQDIVSGVYGGSSNPTAGYFGNMMQRRRIELAVPNIRANQTYYWAVQTIDAGLKAGNWSTEQNITTPSDTTKPVISVNSPTPADGASQSGFTFTINVTVYDNINLTNVTLYGSWGGWHANVTNTSGLNNTQYVFNIDLTGYGYGQYAYQILAYDNTSNSNTTANRTLNIPAPSAGTGAAGGGGGAAGGAGTTRSFSISAQEIKSIVISGETKKQTLEIINNGTSSINFTAESDSPYFIIRDKEFFLKPNETKSLEILFVAPSDAKPGIYTATITIKSDTSTRTVTAIMEVKQKQALFDIKINIPERFRILIPGEEIFAEIQLINIGKIGQVDVIVNYAIVDDKGKVIVSATEPIGVEVVSSFTKSLVLPSDLQPGTYIFAVNATYQGVVASNKQEFKVVAQYSFADLLEKNLTSVVIFVIIIILVYVGRKSLLRILYKERRLERREKLLEKEAKKTRKELKRIAKELRRFKK